MGLAWPDMPESWLHLANPRSGDFLTVALNLHDALQPPLPWHSTLVTSTSLIVSTLPSSEAYVSAPPEPPSNDEQYTYTTLSPEEVNVPEDGLSLGQDPATQRNKNTPGGEFRDTASTDVANLQALAEQENMKEIKTKATIGILATLISYMSLNSLYRAINPEAFIWYEEDREEQSWIATSKSWLDRKACRWLSTCGAAHFRWVKPWQGHSMPAVTLASEGGWQHAWSEGKDNPDEWDDDERVLREIPDYVIEYAPLVHLFSGEQFWPCDIAEHLHHVDPFLNYTPMQSEYQDPTLRNLDRLNDFEHGKNVFLTSKDNVEERPEWLEGEKNIPNSPPDSGWRESLGEHFPGSSFFDPDHSLDHDDTDQWNSDQVSGIEDEDLPTSLGGHGRFPKAVHEDLRRRAEPMLANREVQGGRSDAPAVLVVVDKGHGVVDAFWFFFYSFNLGNVVFNIRFGNHVGDWEHTAIRFHNGVPKAVFFSEHNFGSAYSYGAVEKFGKRPIIYSATGTHAMYATPGLHPYVLPWGILHDETDKGPLWDPALNAHTYRYDYKNDTLRSSNLSPKAPTEWFFFAGHWGDKFYPLGDKRQYRFAGQYHYVNGPLGPRFKSLGRKKICPGPPETRCVIKNWLGGSSRLGRYRNLGEGDELTAELEHEFFD